MKRWEIAGALAALLLFAAAWLSVEPSAQPPRSTLVSREPELRRGALTNDRPDGRKHLRKSAHPAGDFPRLPELGAEQREAVVYTLNQSPGPCAPCMDEGISLADCWLSPPAACDVVDDVVNQVVARAQAGAPLPVVFEAAAYADGWYPVQIQKAWPTVGQGLPVVVFIDPASAFAPEVQSRLERINAQVPLAVTYVLLPTPEGEALSRSVLKGAAEGHFFEAWTAALTGTAQPLAPDPALDAMLEANLRSAEALGVRTTPTIFVDGFRLRGFQSEASWARLVELRR